MSTTAPLLQHHKHCDELFARAEDACAKGEWAGGADAFGHLQQQLEIHFLGEEELLFPAFEAATGIRSGPTEIMRGEHRNMRDLLARLAMALAEREGDDFGGTAETLLILMQQHNLKEENILYPMCDKLLVASAVADSLRQHLQAP